MVSLTDSTNASANLNLSELEFYNQDAGKTQRYGLPK